MISLWSKMEGRKGLLGLEWGTRSCRLVHFKRDSENGPSVIDAMTLALPEERDVAVQTLRGCLIEHHWLGMPAALSFEDPTLHLRRLELPKMPPEDLKEAIRWQMRDIAEGSIEDYLIRYSILHEVASDIPRLVVLGFAVKKGAMEEQRSLLVKAGLKATFIEPKPVTLAATIERRYRSEDSDWWVGLWLGDMQAYFVVVGRGKLHFAKSIPMDASQEGTTQVGFLSRVAVEVQNALDAFFVLYKIDKVRRMLLLGEGAAHPGIADYLTKNVGIQTEVFDPLIGLNMTPQAKIVLEKNPMAFTVALSMTQVAS